MEGSRRDFLKGLVATAIAASLPTASGAEVEQKSEWLLDRFTLTMNGELPDAVALDDAGGGWHHFRAYFTQSVNDGFHMDFTKMDGGGLRIMGDKQMWIDSDSEETKIHNTQLISDQGKTTFSMFVKFPV